MLDTRDLPSDARDTWKSRGYWIEGQEENSFVVAGDTGQFYLDAVANEAKAPLLMEKLRRQNSDEYARYREDAADDGIDLDASQDVFARGQPAAWR